ncbi:phosphatase PAP2 family protein [Sphingosinicellaceae bacterium]|nr:phosphatase PAP2 family protein [Sphingosinicellaceae bacterium]
MRYNLPIGACVAALVVAAPAAASDKAWHLFADLGAYGIPVAAAGITVLNSDHNGLVQLAETGALTFASTEGLKYAVNERRPNGGNHSFPSGHTSLAFAGAGYLHARYGWQTGLPFELVAALVGYSRVHTHDHHWYDVVAGAAIGEGSAFLFTRRLNDSTRVSMGGDSTGGLVQLSTRF